MTTATHDTLRREQPLAQRPRRQDRSVTDRSAILATIDACWYCTVAFVNDGLPFAIPMSFARIDDAVYLHGAKATRITQSIANRHVCLVFTQLDELVLAPRAMHHSMNYRSVMVGEIAQPVENIDDKRAAFVAMIEKVEPGRSQKVIMPNSVETSATSVLRISLANAVGKARSGPPTWDVNDVVDAFVGVRSV